MSLLNTKIEKKEGKVRALVYGKPMSGKTTFATTFPKPFFISTDGNVSEVDGVVLKEQMEKTLSSGSITKISGWEYFLDLVKEIENDDKYETIVIDLLTDLYDFAKDYKLAQEGVKEESDLSMGKGWALVRKEFMNGIKPLLRLENKNIVLIAHSIEYDGGIKTQFPDRLLKEITGYVDLYSYLNVEPLSSGELARILYTITEFGKGDSGNRLDIKNARIFATYDSIMQEINKTDAKTSKGEK